MKKGEKNLRQNFYEFVTQHHALKVRPGYNQATYMIEIQHKIDSRLLALPLNEKSPFSKSLHAPVRKLHQLPNKSNIIHEVIADILNLRNGVEIPDIFRKLHMNGAKCLFQVNYDLDMEYPDQQILYLHIIDNDIDCYDKYIDALFDAFHLPMPITDLGKMERGLLKAKPDKHDLQNAVKCYNPVTTALLETTSNDDDGNNEPTRTKLLTKKLAWLKWYFHPHMIDRFSLDSIEYFEHLGELLESINIQKWREYLLFIWLNHVSAWFSDTYRLYHHIDASMGDLPNSEPELKLPSLKMHKLSLCQEAWWQSSSQDFLAAERDHLTLGKALADKITAVMKSALYDMFENSGWERRTKAEAQMKLKTMVCNVGWSDVPFPKFPSYDHVQYFDEWISLGWQYQYNVVMNNAHKKVNKKEWRFIAYNIVNACYSRELNALYIPPSLFYSPYLYLDEEKYPETFASLGSIIAHELYHAFDYDSKNVNYLSMLQNWWAPKDNRQFLKDSKMTIALYSRKTPISSRYREHCGKRYKHHKINGRLTLSENIADIVALHISYDAFVKWWNSHYAMNPGAPAQERFFHAFALSQTQIYTPQALENALTEDVHAIASARVNLPLSIFPPFLALYRVQPKDPMFTPLKHRPKFFLDQKNNQK